MVHLKDVSLGLIVAESHELAIVREPRTEGVLENTRSLVVREVLERSVERDVRNLDRILLPLG